MYDAEKLLSLLICEEYRAIDEKGKIYRPSHDIYKKISEKMLESNSEISTKHIYQILRANRKKMYTSVLNAFDIKNETNNSTDMSNYSLTETITDASVRRRDTEKSFRLVISGDKWNKIKKKTVTYNNRKYMVLKPGKWSDLFAEKIYQQAKIECAIAFKRAKIYVRSNAKRYAVFNRKCKECSAIIYGFLLNNPQKSNDAIFECKVTNFQPNFIHSKKRQLKGYLREKIATELVDGRKCASEWRRDEAIRLMEIGDSVPPIIYDSAILRKAKQQLLDKRLQIQSTDPMKNLQNAKHSTLRGTIRNIGYDPFYCLYWSEEQRVLYKNACKDKDCFLAIDATGGIANKLLLPNGKKSPYLFLYQCMCVTSKGSFPAFQMISTKQHASQISFFLLEILRSSAPIPPLVVSDFSKAILLAVARIFGNCRDLQNYLEICFNIMFSKCTSTLPDCFIRLDVSHIVALVARWPCLKRKTSKIRQFFLRCICIVYQSDDLIEIESLLKSVLIVALSEEIGENGKGELLDSEVHLRFANNRIKGVTIDDNILDNECFLHNADDEGMSESWSQWATIVYNQAEKIASYSIEGMTVNAFYDVEVARKIRSLMGFLPLWTGIMRRYFKIGDKTATSSSVEAEFSTLKCKTFKDRLPMRVDKFILQHLKYIDGKLLLANAEHHNRIMDKENTVIIQTDLNEATNECPDLRTIPSNEDKKLESTRHMSCDEVYTQAYNLSTSSETTPQPSHFTDFIEIRDQTSPSLTISPKPTPVANGIEEVSINSLNQVENWRGKATQDTPTSQNVSLKRHKPNYLDSCPEWSTDNIKSTVGLPLIRNGNLCNPVIVNKQTIVVHETCAFDSILQIVIAGLALYESYNTKITDSANHTIQLARQIFNRNKIQASDYVERAQILKSIGLFEKRSTHRQIQSLNVNSNAAHLAEYLFRDSPSYVATTTCSECSHIFCLKNPTLTINVNVILKNGFHMLQDAINDVHLEKRKITCKKCKYTQSETDAVYGYQVIIDTSIITDKNYHKNSNSEMATCYLKLIPKVVIIGKQKYGFAGLVSYRPYNQETNDGHYTALIHDGLNWQKYDDIETRKTYVSENEVVIPHVLIYVTSD